MANRNFASGGKIYSMHVMPVLLDCNFIVDSTNGNGYGVRSLKGPLISKVYMNSTAPNASNPNPDAGVIVVQLSDNYNKYFGGFAGFVSPVGSPVSSLTANVAYVITSLGTASAAQWVAAGVPSNIVPAVGVAFIAKASGSIGGSATAAPSAAAGSGIDHIEVLGDANTSIAPVNGSGGQIVLQCFKNGVLTAPAAGTAIGLAFYLSNSSIQIAGE